MNKHIIVHGFNASGTSALLDLFSNNKSIITYPMEFHYYRLVGGISQLKYDLLKKYSTHVERDLAARTFLRNIEEYNRVVFKKKRSAKNKIYNGLNALFYDYINVLRIAEFKGYSFFSLFYQNKLLEPIHHLRRYIGIKFPSLKRLVHPKYSIKVFTYSENEFDLATSRLIDSLVKFFTKKNTEDYDFTVFTHFLSKVDELDTLDNLLNLQGCIVIHRDPRDVFATFLDRGNTWSGVSINNSVRQNIEAFKLYYENNNIGKLVQSEKLLIIRFESLVLNYEDEILRIQNFLSTELNFENNLFYPDFGKLNIGIYKKLSTSIMNYLIF